MFKVMIIDPNIGYSKNLKEMLKSRIDVELLGIYSDIKKFLKEFVKSKADIVFILVETSHYNGIHLARAIQKSYPDIKIIFFYNDEYFVMKNLELEEVDCLPFKASKNWIGRNINSIFSFINEPVSN